MFPPINKLTVFVFTTTMVSMFFYVDSWSNKVVKVFDSLNDELFLSFFMLVILAGVLIFPLCLPFTKKDLREGCLTILLFDALVILYINSKIAHATLSVIDMFIYLYSFLWFVYLALFWCVSLKHTADMDYIFDKKQINADICCIAAIFSIVITYMTINYFSLHWERAYLIVPFITSAIFSSCHKPVSES